MDEAGIDVSIVSLTCPNVYWGGEAASTEAARESNATMAEAQRAQPDRIRWLASLPWEYPGRAAEELTRSCDEGAVGVMVIANVAGRSLTEPAFEPIWAEIDRRALPVLVHPGEPPGTDLMDMRLYDLSWSVGFMFDTTLAITRMIFDGFLDRFPNLKLIAAHGGGALPYLVGRFEKGDEVELPERRRMTATPSEYLRRIWYDCLTYDPRTLDYLISIVGPSGSCSAPTGPTRSTTWPARSRTPPRYRRTSATRSEARTRSPCSASDGAVPKPPTAGTAYGPPSTHTTRLVARPHRPIVTRAPSHSARVALAVRPAQ
jgi:predicted TIM-barrel fold metal-dependent hydrolase